MSDDLILGVQDALKSPELVSMITGSERNIEELQKTELTKPLYETRSWYESEVFESGRIIAEVEFFRSTDYANTWPHLDSLYVVRKRLVALGAVASMNVNTMLFTELEDDFAFQGMSIYDLFEYRYAPDTGVCSLEQKLDIDGLDLSFQQAPIGGAIEFEASTSVHSVPPVPDGLRYVITNAR